MIDNPRKPFEELITPGNIYDRVGDIESQQTEVSGSADANDEVMGNTGTQIVGNLLSPAPGVEVSDVTDSEFTGTFVSGDGATFNSEVYNIGGVSAGALQWGAKQTDGKMKAGAGAVVLDENGISFYPGVDPAASTIYWYDENGTAIGSISTEYASAPTDSEVTQIIKSRYIPNGVLEKTNISLRASFDGVTGPEIKIRNHSVTGGIIIFNEDSEDIDTRFEGATATNLLVTDGGLDAVQIGNTTAGVIADFRNSGIVFNEDSSDRDFRVESNGNANALFVDGGNDRVGILNGSPSVALDVTGAITASSNITSNAFFNMGATNAQTINAGVITVTGGRCIVDTQGGAATDDLDTINGGSDGDILVIYTANSARDVTAKDGTGNLALAGDFIMTNVRDRLILLKDSGTWVELSRSDNQ